MHEAFMCCRTVQNNPLCILLKEVVALHVSQKVIELIAAGNLWFEYLNGLFQ